MAASAGKRHRKGDKTPASQSALPETLDSEPGPVSLFPDDNDTKSDPLEKEPASEGAKAASDTTEHDTVYKENTEDFEATREQGKEALISAETEGKRNCEKREKEAEQNNQNSTEDKDCSDLEDQEQSEEPLNTGTKRRTSESKETPSQSEEGINPRKDLEKTTDPKDSEETVTQGTNLQQAEAIPEKQDKVNQTEDPDNGGDTKIEDSDDTASDKGEDLENSKDSQTEDSAGIVSDKGKDLENSRDSKTEDSDGTTKDIKKTIDQSVSSHEAESIRASQEEVNPSQDPKTEDSDESASDKEKTITQGANSQGSESNKHCELGETPVKPERGGENCDSTGIVVFTLRKKEIAIIIMVSTTLATIIAAIPVFLGWNYVSNMQKQVDSLETQLQKVNELLRKSEQGAYAEKYIELPAQIPEDFANRLNEAEEKLGQCIQTTAEIMKEMNDTKFNLSVAINKTRSEAWANLTQEEAKTTEYISANFMSVAQWFPIIGTGLIVEATILLVGAIFYTRWRNGKGQQQPNHRSQGHDANNGHLRFDAKARNDDDPDPVKNEGMAWVLSQIKPQRLQNKVGVVNFNEENSKRHRQLIRAAMNLMTTLKNVDVLSVVINKHSDLLNLPPCKVFVVFVDFNQRNVILEDLQKVLGDLKLTTARAINKFSAELILVYAGHTGSRQLPSADLFSASITSVALHQDLREISKRRRFLSIHKDFTEHQKQHISQIISSHVAHE